ncbi:MAG: hypothetical protein MUF18_04475, partial [Fimbriiglobus sp.]|nr:hypothetical protein [Fimbriiglobus sp.]
MRRWSLAFLAGLFTLPAFAQKEPKDALATMTAGDGLKVELFAAEPMLINPTSIDVDHKGRVWVAEAVNYRRKNFGRPILRKEGDRIVVLTDKDSDGKADDATTFYQGEDLYGPLSVLVIPTGKGLRVLVAQSPDILEFTDADGDLKADGPPKKFLTGFGGFDHDHGVHGLHLGPDGKLYFTVGDSGVKDLQSADGKGKKWTSNTTDVQKGTVWRCDLDGKNLELIAHNFRNNYEACVDSFGEIWLSDNDDDGNQQTRICFVFPSGNYGYGPRGPGQTHWHEEQPGIVHKTLRTGFGSPTGIQFYEGTLLPKQYANTLLHCDAGPREVRAFTRKPKGAGYELDKANILTSSDNWFRPSDVCTAPDGSVFVADWYDPGVGGHGMGDHTRGRIYRLTPKDHKGYKVPEVKLDTKEGVLAALGSPNGTVRYLAIGAKATGEIAPEEMKSPELIARLIWAATRHMQQDRSKWMAIVAVQLLQSKDSREQSLAVRLLDSLAADADFTAPTAEGITTLFKAVNTPVAAREVLLHLRRYPAETVAAAILTYATRYDGSDIFYRAALNIACGTDPERRDKILADFDKHFPEWNEKTADLVWELRPKGYLAKISGKLYDREMLFDPKRKLMDVIGSSNDPADVLKLLAYYRNPDSDPFDRRHAFDVFKQQLGRLPKLKDDPAVLEFMTVSLRRKENSRTVVRDTEDRTNAIRLAAVVQSTKVLPAISEVAADAADPDQGPAIMALGGFKSAEAVTTLERLARTPSIAGGMAVQSLGKMQTSESLAALQKLFVDSGTPDSFRGTVLDALVGGRAGTQWLLKLKEDKKFPEKMEKDAGRLLRNSPFQGERNKALILFPPPGKLDPTKL